MSLRKKMAFLAAATMSLGLSALANADTIKYTIVYKGSTTDTTVNSTTLGPTDNQLTVGGGGLGQVDLTSPTVQATANLQNYFDLYALYDPQGHDDAIQGLTISITLNGNIAPVGARASTLAARKKYFGNTGGGVVFSTNADSSANDLSVITVLSPNDAGATAYSEQVGVQAGTLPFTAGLGTDLGRFGIKFTGAVTTALISAIGGNGNSFSLFTSSSSADGSPAPGGSGNITAGSFPITTAAVPEPASLGVLALGGLALMSRRRKTA